jgi:hypothetical protein
MNELSPPFREINWRLVWYLGLAFLIALPFLLAWYIGRRILLLNLPRYALTQPATDYKGFWWNCPGERKRLLYQIARYGFAHPDRFEDMRELLEDGWIRFDPELGMDPTFRSYVLANFPKEAQEVTEGESASQFNWLSIRIAVGIAITAIAVFLFATQQELWQLVVAFSSTFATLAQQLSRTGWYFGGKNPPE